MYIIYIHSYIYTHIYHRLFQLPDTSAGTKKKGRRYRNVNKHSQRMERKCLKKVVKSSLKKAKIKYWHLTDTVKRRKVTEKSSFLQRAGNLTCYIKENFTWKFSFPIYFQCRHVSALQGTSCPCFMLLVMTTRCDNSTA